MGLKSLWQIFDRVISIENTDFKNWSIKTATRACTQATKHYPSEGFTTPCYHYPAFH